MLTRLPPRPARRLGVDLRRRLRFSALGQSAMRLPTARTRVPYQIQPTSGFTRTWRSMPWAAGSR